MDRAEMRCRRVLWFVDEKFAVRAFAPEIDAQGRTITIELLRPPPGVPRDARVMSVNYDWSRRGFGICLEHESFERVELGEQLPMIRSDADFESYRLTISLEDGACAFLGIEKRA